jgi:pimeloyl-ACP methyl ester carboxylesterase
MGETKADYRHRYWPAVTDTATARVVAKQGFWAALFVTAATVVVGLLASALPAAAAPPGRLVDVGGRNLHIYCTGGGSRTIVLEAGGGNAFHTWFAVQPLLAAEYRVCSYDRAGLGFSDARPGQRSIAGIVEDLHALLTRSGEKPPFLLVGHSLGGQFVWKYAEAHSDEVLGVVLADANYPGTAQRRPPEVSEAFNAARDRVRQQRLKKIEESHRTGEWEEMGVPADLPVALRRMISAETKTAKWWEARYAEGDLPDVNEPLRALNVPAVILVSTIGGKLPGLSDEVAAKLAQARVMMARRAVAAKPRKRNRLRAHVQRDTARGYRRCGARCVEDARGEMTTMERAAQVGAAAAR